MNVSMRSFPARALAILLAATAGEAFADVGPPVKITMPPTTTPAISGQNYTGRMEIIAYRAGTLADLELGGRGWRILSRDEVGAIEVVAGEIVSLHFTAVPQDENEPLRLRGAFDGRPLAREFNLGRAAFARAGKPCEIVSIDSAGKLHAFQPRLGEQQPVLAGQAIRLRGRIAYLRPTVPDGPQDMVVGADGIYFEVIDDDSPDPFDEVIYSGLTDHFGYFDVTVDWDDCDITGCDDPDIYLYFETDNGVVNVQDTDLFETDYSWDTQDRVIDDFNGNDVDFGTVMPADTGQHVAIHIHNSIMRAHRFILSRTGVSVEELDVLWPEEERGSGAYYTDGSKEIHISPSRGWDEDTHIHEYGHHFMYTQSVGTPPDYCNFVCDCEPQACDEVVDCGHCMWCPETDHDAWNEGWPNWFADVVTRSFAADYAGYQPLNFRNQEFTTSTCSTSAGGSFPNNSPLLTEGFAGALLRDIEDSTDEDHDNLDFDGDMIADDLDADGVPDCSADALSLGVGEIFTILREDKPRTIGDFIAAFRNRYTDFDQDFWSTTRNVHLSFGFPVPPPRITSQSEGCRSFLAGEDLNLTAQGNGRLLGYQWRRDGVPLADDVRVSGSTTPNLSISNLGTTDGGSYDCLVSTCDQTLSVLSIPVNVQVFPARGFGRAGLAWGRNDLGQLGQGSVCTGPNCSQENPVPKPVFGAADLVAVSASQWHALGLASDGTVWAWGDNYYGQLGTGAVGGTQGSPQKVADLDGVVQVSAGNSHSLALKADGTVWAWGLGSWGQLGNGGYQDRAVPTQVPDLACVVDVAATQYASIALLSDGTAVGWGWNSEGLLGSQAPIAANILPVQVAGVEDVASLACGGYHCVGRKTDGSVVAWGWNSYGQIGDGTQANRNVPTQVLGLSNVSQVSAAFDRSYAVLPDGSVWSWGMKSSSQMCNPVGGNPYQLVPGPIAGLALCAPSKAGSITISSTTWTEG